MKIVVLDGETLNPSNFSRDSLENLGVCEIFDHSDLNMGIVGFGQINRAVAQLPQAFDKIYEARI